MKVKLISNYNCDVFESLVNEFLESIESNAQIKYQLNTTQEYVVYTALIIY